MSYDVVVNFGCSFMNGDRVRYINELGQDTNLGEEIVAAKLLSKELNCDYVHLSKTGGANDTIFRRLYRWVESNTQYKNPLIIIGLTETARFSYFSEHKNRFYNLQPHHINSYRGMALEQMNERVTNNVEPSKKIKDWLIYYLKFFYNTEHMDKKLQQEIMFLHHYLKGNNCDYRILNSLQDSLGDIKSKINYITFQDEHYSGEDCWNQYLQWQMEHIDNEPFECMDEHGKQKYRSPFPPFGKRFCEGHPSPNANKELFERIYESLK
tara:strand:- start:257 stop:1057 length:801 start_codon:yes stop_codon:yes gene_type:complete